LGNTGSTAQGHWQPQGEFDFFLHKS